MANIFKIILTTLRIFIKLIKLPFGFFLIIVALLDLVGVIGPFTPSDDIIPLFIVFSTGLYIINSTMKKKKVKENNKTS